MVSIECVERGIARYLDQELLPNIRTEGVKGFAIGMAASIIVKRGGNLLRDYARMPLMQQMGIVTPDGAFDIDVMREAAKANIPDTGLALDLPMGIALRINADDVDCLYDCIVREARV